MPIIHKMTQKILALKHLSNILTSPYTPIFTATIRSYSTRSLAGSIAIILWHLVLLPLPINFPLYICIAVLKHRFYFVIFLIKPLDFSHFHCIDFKIPNVSYVAQRLSTSLSFQLHTLFHNSFSKLLPHWPSCISLKLHDVSASGTLHIFLASWCFPPLPFFAQLPLLLSLDPRRSFIFSKQLSLTFHSRSGPL